jgi:tetratricopeptide (TPR) repeat protein
VSNGRERLEQGLANQYQLERELGQGGMATVYLARDLRHDRLIALKVLRPDLAATLGPERFLREILTAARLEHPHILSVHDSGETAGLLWYTMPYVQGESLRDRLRREVQLPVEEAVRLTREVAEALDYAHAEGIVHRDVKPENILLSGGHARVADFGLAKAVSVAGGEQLTGTGLVVGTPAYMSPEQAAGDGELDGRADLYSLGCVLYEMLAGEPPFTGPTAQAIIAKRMAAPPPRIRTVRTSIPEAVDLAVARALSPVPADRFATAAQFVAALERTVPLRPRWLGRRGVSIMLLFGTVLTAALGWMLQRDRPAAQLAGSPSVVAVFPFRIRGNPELAYLGEGMVSLLGRSLDQAGELRSVDARAVLSMLEQLGKAPLNPERAAAIAARLGAGRYILGDIIEGGGRIRYDAAAYDATQGTSPVAQAAVEGLEGAIFRSVDELAARLLTGGGSNPKVRYRTLASVTTDSLGALKAFLRGEAALRSGDMEAATADYRRAVEVDSSFALGYLRLANAAGWIFDLELRKWAHVRALALRARLPERDRLLLDAMTATERGRMDEAERLYRAIVSTYPDQLEAWFALGDLLYHSNNPRGRSVAEARPAFERVLQIEPEWYEALDHLAFVAADEGRYGEQDSLLTRLLTLYPKSESELPLRTLLAISRSDSAAVAEALRVLKQSDDGTVEYTLAIVVQGSRRPLEGAQIARLMLAPSRVPQVQAYGHRVLATLQLAQGQWSGAMAELAAAAAIDSGPALEYHALLATAPFLTLPPAEVALLQQRLRMPAPSLAAPTGSHPMLSVDSDIRPLVRAYLPGLLSARDGHAAGAERVAGELERRGKSDTLASAFASAIRARLHFVRRDWPAARAALDSARVPVVSIASHVSPILSQGYLSFLRAEVLRQSAGEEEALRWYDTAWRHSVFNLVYLPPGLLRRGQIEERRGRRAEAIVHYTRFLEFWADPDSALRPLADSARASLRQLGALAGAVRSLSLRASPYANAASGELRRSSAGVTAESTANRKVKRTSSMVGERSSPVVAVQAYTAIPGILNALRAGTLGTSREQGHPY